jgi:hypothetical protein
MRGVILGLIFLLAGGWVAWGAQAELSRFRTLLESGARAPATVIYKNEFNVPVSRGRGRVRWERQFFIHAELALEEGKKGIVDPRVSESFFQTVSDGDVVELAYLPDDMHQYVFVNDSDTINASRSRLWTGFALLGAGTMFVGVGVAGIREARRRASPDYRPPEEPIVRIG